MAIGAGWQAVVAYVNIACYYLFGVPLGLVMGYKLGMGVKVSLFSPCFQFSFISFLLPCGLVRKRMGSSFYWHNAKQTKLVPINLSE